MKGIKVEMFCARDEELIRGVMSETQAAFLRHTLLSESGTMNAEEHAAWARRWMGAVPEPHSAWLEVRVSLGWTNAEVRAIVARIGQLMDELGRLASVCSLSGTNASLHREIEELKVLSAEWTELVRDDGRLA